MRIQLSFADPWSIDGPLQDSIGAAKGEHHLLACHDSQRDLGVEWRAGIEDPDIRVCPSPGRGGRFATGSPPAAEDHSRAIDAPDQEPGPGLGVAAAGRSLASR